MAQPSGQGPSWKKRGEAGRPDKAGKRSWQHGGKPAAEEHVSSRSRKLLLRILVGVALLLIVGAITWIAYYFGGDKPLTVILFANHAPAALNQPLNAYNAKLAQQLSDWTKKKVEGSPRKAVPVPAELWQDKKRTQQDWLNWLIDQGKSAGDTFVYFFGMPGHADDQKGPYLWVIPPDAEAPDWQKHRLYVSDLLARIRADLPRKKIVLIFDCTQEMSSRLHGIACNEFASGLQKIESQIAEVNQCFVLCASAPGQRSWPSPEQGVSIFGHYLLHALEGAARHPSNRPMISLRDVHNYLAEKVENWSQANRSAEQKPFLLPAGKLEQADGIALAILPREELREPDIQSRTLAELRGDWDKYYQLAGLDPSPEIVVPHAWKRYTELMLRLEQLVWAGADPAALRNTQRALFDHIKTQVELPKWSNGLLAQDAFAPDPASKANDPLYAGLTSMLSTYWKTQDATQLKETDDKWRELTDPIKKDKPGLARELLIYGWRWTIEQALKEPDRLDSAEAVLKRLDDSFSMGVRPADVHFVRMLVRDSQVGPWAKLLKNHPLLKSALSLRMKAERLAWRGVDQGPLLTAHLGNVYRWAQAEIDSADKSRQMGEDLLFDADEKSWARAQKEFFEPADQQYSQAGAKAKLILEAYLLRDRAYARLPAYSNWLAGASTALPAGSMNAAAVAPLLVQVETAWSQTHQLAGLLKVVSPENEKAVMGLVGELKKNLTAFDQVLQQQIRLSDSPGEAQATSFHQIEHVLKVPFFLDSYQTPPEVDKVGEALRDRMVLLRKLSESSRRLYINSQQAKISEKQPVLIRFEDAADRHLRLSFAALGLETVQEINQSGLTPSALNWNVESAALQNKSQFRDACKVLGEKLGRQWSALGALFTSLEEAKSASEILRATGTIDTLPPAERWLARAAHFARQLDAGVMEHVDPGNQLPPVQTERWHNTHRFLIWQAERAFLEGWADVIPKTEDYAKRVASIHLGAAEELLKDLADKEAAIAGKGWHALLSATGKRINNASTSLALTVNGSTKPAHLHVTDEPLVTLGVGFRAAPDSQPIAGFPIIRLSSQKPADPAYQLRLQEKQPEVVTHHFSRARTVGESPAEVPVIWKNPLHESNLGLLKQFRSQLSAMVLYRGHRFSEDSIDVVLHTTPIVRWVRPAPENKQGLVVFGSRVQDGHIHILFDITTSMIEDVVGKKETKIDAARNAMRYLLGSLPKDIKLSISLFRGDEAQPNAPCTTIIFDPRKWDKEKYLDEVMKKIPTKEKIDADWNQGKGLITTTPLVRAIRETFDTKDPARKVDIDTRMPFTLLVVTDGVDNDYEGSAGLGVVISNDLLSYKHPNFFSHILLFSVDENSLKPSERSRLRELKTLDTDALKEEFKRIGRTPPRLWDKIYSYEELIKTLETALRPTVAIAHNEDYLTKEMRISRDRDSNWGQEDRLLPGTPYDVSTAGIKARINLERGDKLALQIERKEFLRRFIVPSIADLDPKIKEEYRKQKDNVQFTLLSQGMKTEGNYALELQTALEQTTEEGSAAELTYRRPLLAWFDLTPMLSDPKAKREDVFTTITQNNGEIAPVWKLRADRWPPRLPDGNPEIQPAGYQLNSYWISQGVKPVRSIRLSGLDAPTVSPLDPVNLPGPGARFLETQKRSYANGQWLYVRCQHDQDKPFLLQLRPTGAGEGFTRRLIAEEHRFYSQANSVSAWFSLADLGQEKEYTLDIYLLRDLLQQQSPGAVKLEYESNEAAIPFDRLYERRWSR